MILIGKSFQSIFQKHREQFLKCYADDTNKPLTHSQLVKRLVDSNGKQYYGFPKDMMMPLERHGKLMFYMQHISKGLTAQEDELIDDAISNILLIEKDASKINIRIAGLLSEKERRRKLCIHTELFYNYLAVQLIREDEAIEIFDNDIQMQKVAQFKSEAKKKESTYQFFQMPEFKKLNDMLKLSPEEWMSYWGESENQQLLLKEILQVYTSASILTKDKGSLKAN